MVSVLAWTEISGCEVAEILSDRPGRQVEGTVAAIGECAFDSAASAVFSVKRA
jgi:hypothetical protein